MDTRYSKKTPPVAKNPVYPKDGTVRELILKFSTGADDLRGDDDNVNLTVNLTDGTQQKYNNINLGGRWLPNYTEHAQVILTKPIRPEEIKSLVIATTFGGGTGGDNWDMQALTVRALGGDLSKNLQVVGAHRFTGEKKTLTVPISANATTGGKDMVTKLVLQIRTGGDDLRGGKDNLNVEIHLKDGSVQKAMNVNKGQRWGDNSTSHVPITLTKAVRAKDIDKIVLRTTFTGGVGGDNWNMDWIRVRGFGPEMDAELARNEDKFRFTGEKKVRTVDVK